MCLCCVWGAIVLGCWVSLPLLLLLHLYTTHTSLPHRHAAAVGSQSPPISLSIAFTCVTLHVLPWRSPLLPPQLVSLLCQYEDGADSSLVMQTACRRHRFPLEGGLFLPVGTKYTRLLNTFMGAHLIPACQETSLHTLCTTLSIHFPEMLFF